MSYVGCLPRILLVIVPLLGIAISPVALGQEDAWSNIRQDYRQGQFDSARNRLLALLARNPRDRDAHYYLGLIGWRTGRLQEAATHFRQLLTLDPDGPFAKDAQSWLTSYRAQLASGQAAPTPVQTPVTVPSVLKSLTRTPPDPTPSSTEQEWDNESEPMLPLPSPRPSNTPIRPSVSPTREATPAPDRTQTPLIKVSSRPVPTPRPSSTPAPWLQAEPLTKGSRPRSARPKPGYFKAADGTFEFLPPNTFVLLDEGVEGREFRALFGPRAMLKDTHSTVHHPTVLLVWREFTELTRLNPAQRAAREQQLLQQEATTYGPGARNEARFGLPALNVRQRQESWVADTWLFFRYGRLYAITYGGDERLNERYRSAVTQSLSTFSFYP